MQRDHWRGQRLLALFIVGGLALNFPLLALGNTAGRIGGIPVLYLYIFVCWALLIVLFAWVIERR